MKPTIYALRLAWVSLESSKIVIIGDVILVLPLKQFSTNCIHTVQQSKNVLILKQTVTDRLNMKDQQRELDLQQNWIVNIQTFEQILTCIKSRRKVAIL